MASREQLTLKWRGFDLFANNRKTDFSIVPDAKWPQMWRVRKPDGTLTDMVNLSRAKDAAAGMVQHEANLELRRQGALRAPVR